MHLFVLIFRKILNRSKKKVFLQETFGHFLKKYKYKLKSANITRSYIL